jgi:hypothetical protein
MEKKGNSPKMDPRGFPSEVAEQENNKTNYTLDQETLPTNSHIKNAL